MNKLVVVLLTFLSLSFLPSHFPLHAFQEYTEPKEVATTEGLPVSLVNQSVCAISGEYTDRVQDVVIPGPEPLVINRVYTSFSSRKPWYFNHYDKLILGDVLYKGIPSFIIAQRQPSSAQLEFIYEKKDERRKLKKMSFKLIVPKGLTNGASILSGKTNLKNHRIDYYHDENLIVSISGSGSKKTFKQMGYTEDDWPICGQLSEEKINGSRVRYLGEGTGISGASEIICENSESKTKYSSVKFRDKVLNDDKRLQTLLTSDGRKLSYYFKHHHYRIKEKTKHSETTIPVDNFYLYKVDHPYAPAEKYVYKEKSLSRDLHITEKQRDEGRRFLNIEYYHKGTNYLGGEVGNVEIKEKDDFRLDRVKRLLAPVGHDQTPVTTHRFDYHASIKKDNKIGEGYTNVYDAKNHKTRYKYDEDHRLISIVKYSGTESSDYSHYTEECFNWDDEGCLISKIFKDGNGHVHHARTFVYDSQGNVLTSTLCGKLTGEQAPALRLNSKGRIVENGYEREIKNFIYSDDGFNLLLSENDSSGKTIRYEYYNKTDRLKAKYISFDGRIQLREFYFYDCNHALEKKVIDDGCQEPYHDLCFVNERHITVYVPRVEAPVGLPESSEEWIHDFQSNSQTCLKRSTYTYSAQGQILEEQVFDAEGALAYVLKWEYDTHGNVISETNPLGVTIKKKYDLATDNLMEEVYPDYTILNTYDFANRLIERKEVHKDQEFVAGCTYDRLGNCKTLVDHYGNTTKQVYDDFGRIIEIHSPQLSLNGVLETPIEKVTYDIANFPLSKTDANGLTTFFEVNLRGQPTKIVYPDGTQEEMFYTLEGKLARRIAPNGTRTEYLRDPLGRVTQEIIYGDDAVKKTVHRYNAFRLVETIDPEGNQTKFVYDFAGRLKETVKNEQKIENFYDSLGRLSEIREYYGYAPEDYRATVKKYDLLNRVIEERLEDSKGHVFHYSRSDYDLRGNKILEQTGDQKIFTEFNTRNQPIKITDGLGNVTHIEYNPHFINAFGQKVHQKIVTDPLGYRTVETCDAAQRVVEVIRLNLLGEKIAAKTMSYDLVGHQVQTSEEVIEEGKIKQTLVTLFAYNSAGKILQVTEAAGTPEQKITRFLYNHLGQKEAQIKPDGIEIRYTYDAFERLKSVASSDQSVAYTYEYNLLDQATLVRDQLTGKATHREYAQEQLKRESLANDLSLTYTYDRTGRVLSTMLPDQSSIAYTYNAVDLKQIARVVNGKTLYTHHDISHSLSGEVTQAQLAGQNGLIDYQYDALCRCQSITSKSFQQQVPADGYDAAGNLLKFELQTMPYHFTYDDYYHVQSEKGHSDHRYAFDSLENRVLKDDQKIQHNALNQIVKLGEEELIYDLNGNLTKNGTQQYTYDAFNRLIKVASQELIVTYTYDAFNRCMSKTTNGVEENYLYQCQDEIGCWKNGVCQEVRMLGKNPLGRTTALEIQGIAYVPIHDLRGNVCMLMNMEGELVEQYRYTAYGEREVLGPSGEKRERSEVGNPWQYAGKRIDEETGLVAFGMRYYDPNLGRWTTPDPADFIDGSNLYAYVHNNALRYVDQYGLFAEGFSVHANFVCPSFDGGYKEYTTSLGSGLIDDPIYGKVSHFKIEDKLEAAHNPSSGPFCKSQRYWINDLKDASGQNYSFNDLPKGTLIVYMCGIKNTLIDFTESLYHVAIQSGGYNVEGVHCQTFGFVLDSKCYQHALNDNACYEGTRIYQEIVREFHANNPPECTMLSIFHSRGCVYGRNALIDSTQKERMRVEVLAIAPGCYIHRDLCKDVSHFSCKCDIVPKIDSIGKNRCKDTTTTLEPQPNIFGWDHSFTSPTYAPWIKARIKSYLGKSQ